MIARVAFALCLLACAGLPGWSSGCASAEPRALRSVDPAELRVTSGGVLRLSRSRFAIRSPALRAQLGTSPQSAVEIAFVYDGPGARSVALASGELRRQIGLKLRAQDSCNVLYVMWQIEPAAGIVVSAKHNPGQHEHGQCGDRGYQTLSPDWARGAAPGPRPGEHHTLAAALESGRLTVNVDGVTSWVGSLPATAMGFDGPVGMRSDNGDFEVEFRAAGARR